MLQMTISISDVDYSAISAKVVPMLLESMKEKDGHSKIVDVLSRFRSLPGKAAAAALNILPQDTKDEIAVHWVSTFDDQILEKLQALLQEKELPLEVTEIATRKAQSIKLIIRFGTIDYNRLIAAAYPRVIQKFSKHAKFARIFAAVDKMNGQSDRLINSAVDVLSQEEKDELTICIIDTYEPEILSVINALAEEYEIRLTFSGVDVGKI